MLLFEFPSPCPLGPPASSLASAPTAPTPEKPHHHKYRPNVSEGDIIKVQTNLGWEKVTVKKKHPNGKLDILFADGELMIHVMPRILKQGAQVRAVLIKE